MDGVLKAKLLNQKDIPWRMWKNVKCNICNRRCCHPCTSQGLLKDCHQLTDGICNVCGHSADDHVFVKN